MSRAPGMTLDRVAELAGEAAAYALAEARGGRRLTVPKTNEAGTELAEIVGAAAAAKLTAVWGGLDFMVAKNWRRSVRAARLAATGASKAAIAERLGCTERTVYELLERARTDGDLPPRPPRQGDPDQLPLLGEPGA